MNPMTRLSLKALAAAVLLVPTMGFAEGMSYTYIESSYALTDFDGTSADGDGFSIEGSHRVLPNWFVFASFSDLSSDFGDAGDFDTEGWTAGAGYIQALGDFADFLISAAYLKEERDAEFFDGEETIGFSERDEGYGLSFGLRGRPSSRVELEGSADYVSFGGSDEDGVALNFAGRILCTPMFAIGLNLGVDDGAKSYGAHLRYNFR